MRHALRLSVTAAALAALAGCGKRAPTRPQIGVALAAPDSFDSDLERGMRRVADSLGFDLHVVTADGDTARQASLVDGFVARRMDAIVIAPVGDAGAGTAVDKGNAARIPVFTVARPADGGDVVSEVESDDRQGGKLLGDWVVARLEGGGNVAILDQPAPDVRARVAGFKGALSGSPNLRILADPTVDPPTRAAARHKMDALLATDQHIDAVFGTDDEMALGAVAAIQAAGRKDVLVVAYDAVPEARAALLQGTPLVALAAQDPVALGARAIAGVAVKLKGGTVPATVTVPVRLVQKP